MTKSRIALTLAGLAILSGGLALGLLLTSRTPQSQSPAAKQERSVPTKGSRPGASAAAKGNTTGRTRSEAVQAPADNKKHRVSRDPVQDRFGRQPVLSQKSTPRDAEGNFERTKIVRARFKYPFLRIQERVRRNPRTGQDEILGSVAMVADHVMVKLAPGATEKDLREMLAGGGRSIRRKMYTPGRYLVEIGAPEIDQVPKAVEDLGREGGTILQVEPDYLQFTTQDPDDPLYSELWGLHNTGQQGGTPDADIDAPEAWDTTTGSSAVIVGVIDTGIDYTHEDLAPNIWTNSGEIPGNSIDDDGNGFVDDVRGWNFVANTNDPMDDHFHGTHVAGTIGAVGNNAVGVVGVNWQVSMVPIKFLNSGGSGTTSDAIDAIWYGTVIGADLTSNSWGGGPFSQGLKDAIDAADAAGILFVAAAGNSGQDTDIGSHYPSSYSSPNIISVAATTRTDTLASFSNYGVSSVDLGAPGVNILSCFPANDYQSISGTSMATPHVAGVAALLKAAVPVYTHDEIKDRILDSVESIPALAGLTVTGGRLNASNALQFANQAFLSFAQTTVDDGAGAGTSGNQDGITNPGETVGLAITLRNLGTEPASGVSAVLSLTSPDPNVTLLSTSSIFGTVPPLGTAPGGASYLVQLSPGTPAPHTVGLTLTITDDASNSWTSNFTLDVRASYPITGTVRLDGAPLAGATVRFSGPNSGEVVTAADGTYTVSTYAGAYVLSAHQSGAVDTLPVQVTVPPAQSSVDFSFTTATVSGGVTSVSSGQPIAGATVEVKGDLVTQATTAGDGTYSVTHVFGRASALVLTAKLPGSFFDSLPVGVTVPPDVSNVDFQLDAAPDIAVSPASVSLSANLGDTPQATLTLDNLATGALDYEVQVHTSGYATGDKGDIIRPLFFFAYGVVFDGSGVWLSHTSGSELRRVDPLDGFLLGTLDLAGVAERPRAMAWDGTDLWVADWEANKIHRIDVATGQSLQSIDSPEGKTPGGIDVDGSNLYVSVTGTIYTLDRTTGAVLSRISVPKELYLNDLDFYNGALWASTNRGRIFKLRPEDGTILGFIRGPEERDEEMSGSSNQLFGIHADENGAFWVTGNKGTMYLVASGELHWLRPVPEKGTVSGSSSGSVDLAFDASAAGVGVHQAAVHVKSNDPDEPDVRIPVTFTVGDASNAAPVAVSQNVTLAPDAEKPITLTATDADGDPLTFRVVAPPSQGFLSGAAPTLLYTPIPGFTGTDSFTFVANDGTVDSAVATVSIDAAGAPDISVSPLSFDVSATMGQVPTRTLTVSNTGTRALTVRVFTRTDSGGAGSGAIGNVLAVHDITNLYPSYIDVQPHVGPWGVAYDGEVLWVSSVVDFQRPRALLRAVNPADGSLVRELDFEGVISPEHLDWDGSHLWATSSARKEIYEIDTRTGTVLRTISFPAPAPYSPAGIVRVGTVLHVIGIYWTPYGWVAEIFQIDAGDGSLLGSFPVPNLFVGGAYADPLGLTYLNGSLWLSTSSHTGPSGIIKIRPTDGKVEGKFTGPDSIVLDVTSDGERGLWITSRSSRKLYHLDTGELSWLRADPRTLVVPPSGSQDITLTLDTVASGFGEHATTVHLESNDADERHVTVPVILRLPNQPPTADAGPDQAVPEDAPGLGATVYLNGFGSSDVDGTITTYEWEDGGGPIASGVNPQATLALGVHTLTLRVTDDDGATGTDTVTITVAPLPEANALAWGSNGNGALGDGTTTDRYTAVSVSGPLSVTSVSAGGTYSLGLQSDGTLWAWGRNYSYGIGDGTTERRLTPVQVVGFLGVRTMDAGYTHGAAVLTDRTVWTWGQNDDGQLGDGTTTNRLSPVQVPGLTDVIAVSAGWDHTLALKADGTVWAWGSDRLQKLGNGFGGDELLPVQVENLTGVVAIAAGADHSLALDQAGNVWGWGSTFDGRLGLGSYGLPTVPVPIKLTTIDSVMAIAAGAEHSLFLKSDGTVWAAGDNEWGQLGDGTRQEDRWAPVQVVGLSGITRISAGSAHSMSLGSDGTVWAWGANSGRLGDGSTTMRLTPVQALGVGSAISIVASKGSFSLSAGTVTPVANQPPAAFAGTDVEISLPSNSVTLDGSGSTDSDGSIVTYQWTKESGPMAVISNPAAVITQATGLEIGVYIFRLTVTDDDGATDFDEIAVTVTSSGGTADVWGWGSNTYGQLGDGTQNTIRDTPVQTLSSSGMTQVSAGVNHSLSLRNDGTVWSWGNASQGQLGIGPSANRSTPQQVTGMTSAVSIAAGNQFSLAAQSDGSVWSWGLNSSGQLGDGTTTKQWSPVQVTTMTGAIAVAAGDAHSLALRNDGTVWAWGINASGQLGDGTTTNRLTPVQVSGLTGVTAIAAGTWHSLALKSDGAVWAWGANSSGQLGDGSTTSRSTPVQVAGLSPAVSIGGGRVHSLFVTANRTVWVVGNDPAINTTTPQMIPGLTGVLKADGALTQQNSVVLRADGSVWAWGDSRALGDGMNQFSSTPVRTSGLSGMTDVSIGSEFGIATNPGTSPSDVPVIYSPLQVTAAVGVPFSYSIEAAGEEPLTVQASPLPPGLSLAGSIIQGTPTAVGDTSVTLQVSNVHGTDVQTLVISVVDVQGVAWSWGDNFWGQLGDGTTTDRPLPGTIAGLTDVVALAGGTNFVLALRSDGTVWAWGNNGDGQLGDGTTTSRTTPAQVPGLPAISSIACGSSTAMARTSTGSLYIWGDNSSGQIGNNSTIDRTTPLLLSSLPNVIDMDGGRDHSVAVTSNGNVWAWGKNDFGQVGDGTNSERRVPTAVLNLTNVVAVASRYEHNLALKADGTVWAWGNNFSGTLGDGTTLHRNIPVQSSGVAGAVKISCGSENSAALTGSGELYTWGEPIGLGDGSTAQRNSPLLISTISGVIDIAVGNSHVMVRRGDGSVWGWGGNTNGQLGNGATQNVTVPVRASGSTGMMAVTHLAVTDGSTFASNDGTTSFFYTLSGRVTQDGIGVPGVLVTDGTRSDTTDAGGFYALANVPDGSHSISASVAGGSVLPNGWSNPVVVSGADVSDINFTAVIGSRISGRVTLSGAGLENVIVSDGTRSAATDTSGDYTLSGVPDGSHTLTATISGYSVSPSGWSNPVVVGGADVTGRGFTAAVLTTPPTITSPLTASIEVGQPFSYTITASGSSPITFSAGGLPPGLTFSGDTISGTPTLVGATSVSLEATNALGTDTRALALTVFDPLGVPNTPPLITAAPWASPNPVTLPATATLSMSATDSDGPSALTYTWSEVTGPGTVGFTPNGSTSSNQTVADFSMPGVYTLRVTVSDGKSLATADLLMIVQASTPITGVAFGWGNNGFGQVGDGSVTNRSQPVQVLSLQDAVAISAGANHTTALLSDGTLLAWGGDGGSLSSSTAVPVPGISEVVAVSSGGGHTLAVRQDGSVGAWGNNSNGQIGNGSTNPVSVPALVAGVGDVIAAAAGGSHSLVLKSDGTVLAWGANFRGRLGDGTLIDRHRPVAVTGLLGVVAIAAGDDHSLALKADGTVWAWGANVTGQLGDGTDIDRYVPVEIPGLSSIVSLSAGSGHSLAVDANGSVFSWGSNAFGQLGDGTTTDRNTPAAVPGIQTATQISAGASHSFALLSNGTGLAWGFGGHGQLGDGGFVSQSSPRVVLGLINAFQVSAGKWHSTALALDGAAHSISGTVRHQAVTLAGVTVTDGVRSSVTDSSGNYTLPNVPDGSYTLTATRQGYVIGPDGWSNPVVVSGSARTGIDFRANLPPTADAGPDVAVSLPTSQATLVGSGSDSDGSIAGYSWIQVSGPAATLGSPAGATTTVSGLTSGTFVFRLTVTDDLGDSDSDEVTVTVGSNIAWGWGDNFYGQVGGGVPGAVPPIPPVAVAGLDQANPLAAASGGQDHSIGLKRDGTVWAWGRNDFGQLGDGTTVDRLVMVPVSGLPAIQAVAAGGKHSLALGTDGTVWAWGKNSHGQLGDGTTQERHGPVQVSGLTGVTAIAAGGDHSLALLSDGTVRAWGSNGAGRLGDGSTTDRLLPVQVTGLSGATVVSAGFNHSLALLSDGTVRAWGSNWAGQLGDGTKEEKHLPVQVSTLNQITAIAAGLNHNLGLRDDGTVWAWGQNAGGLIPDGLTMLVNPLAWEWAPLFNQRFIGEFYVPDILASDLTISLTSSDTTELTVPATVTIPAGSQTAVFLYDTVDDNLTDGTQKVTITATSSIGTVMANVFVADDESFFAQTVDLSIPKPVNGLTGVTAIAAGGLEAYVLKSDGTVTTWVSTDPTTPVDLALPVPMEGIGAGWNHGFALESTTLSGGGGAYQQDSGADGILSVEVENYDALTDQGGHTWSPNATAGFSGTGALEATPNSGALNNTGYETTSPRLDFQVNFVKTGTHHVWVRGIGPTGSDDSCHVGIDGQPNTTADRISSFSTGWTWSKNTMDSVVATVDVPTTGVHTLNVWMREDGFIIDKVVLTTSATYTPTGTGPAESPRGGGPVNQLPSVSITAPANGASFVAPASVTITADATDTDGMITKVEFFEGANLLGEDTTAPYSFNWTSVPAGSYTIIARATDDQGGTASDSIGITVTGGAPPGSGTGLTGDYFDNIDLTGLILTRTDATVDFNWGSGSPDPSIAADTFSVRWTGEVEPQYSETYTFYTNSDDGVRLWVDGQPLIDNWTNHGPTEDTGVIALVAGQKVSILMEYYEDGGGAVATLSWSSASTPKAIIPQAQLYPTAAPNQPPAVSLTAPTEGQTFVSGSNVTITATASDSDGTVVLVEFFEGANKIGEASTAPWTMTWAAPPVGSYSLTARATDNDAASTTSAAVGITVEAPNQPPAVALTAPTNGQTFTQGSNITLTAAASDTDGTVALVEFFEGVNKIGEASAAPWTMTWTAPPVGSYSLTARATDNDAVSTTSTAVAITVEAPNQPPTVTLTAPTNGQTYTEGANVTFTAAVSDIDGTVTLVEFFEGATKLGQATASPWTFTWPSPPVGSYSLTAKATDDDGDSTTSTPVAITVQASGSGPFQQDPGADGLVSVEAESHDAYVSQGGFDWVSTTAFTGFSGTEAFQGLPNSGTIINTGYAAGSPQFDFNINFVKTGTHTVWIRGYSIGGSDNSVHAGLNGAEIATSDRMSSSVYGQFTWFKATMDGPDATFDVPTTGEHTLNIWMREDGFVVDKIVLTTSSSYTPTGTGPAESPRGGAGNQPPTVALTTPTEGSSFTEGNDLTLIATASDSDGTVTRVEFFEGANKLGEATAPPWSFTWSGAVAGGYSLTARATDDDGASTTSAAVGITVTAPNQPPTVNLTAPTNGQSFEQGTDITLTADASDPDGTVTLVEFFEGANKLGEATAAPWTMTWTGAALGSYSLTARATDNESAQTTSAAVSITVDPPNQPPTVTLTEPVHGQTYTAGDTVVMTANPADPDGTITAVQFFVDGAWLADVFSAPWTFSIPNAPAGSFVITAVAWDDDLATTTSAPANITIFPVGGAPTGTVLRETWTGIPGTTVSALTGNANYPDNPTASDEPTIFEAPVNWADDYGTRMRGYVYAPLSGNYVFWISGDDNCELWLSTDDDPATRVQIATVPGWTSSRQWDKYPAQQSAPIALIAGSRYFIEALQKEGGGGDNLAVGWQLPDTTLERPIPGSRLSPFVVSSNVPPTVSLTAPTQGATFTEPADITLSASASDSDGSIARVEFFEGATLLGQDTTSPYSFSWVGVAAGSYTLTAVAVDDLGAQTTSSAVGITVQPPASPGEALFVVGNVTLNASDAAIESRLIGLGYTVTVVDGPTSVTGDATGKDVIVVSSTVSSGTVNTKFTNVAVPIINWESHLLDDLGMAGPMANTDYGTLGSQTDLSIVDPVHPMAAGLSGTVTVLSAPDVFMWGVPNGTAEIVATLSGDPSRAAIFGYDSGASMPGLVAPARRVGFFLNNSTGANLNASGWPLFDEAVAWAVSVGSTSAQKASSTTTIPPSTGGDITIEGKGSFTTLQEALDAASTGDTVVLGPMRFYLSSGVVLPGGVSLRGKAPHLTILDGKGAATVVRITGTPVDGQTTIEQLTVTRGTTGIDAGTADVLLKNLQVVQLSGNAVVVAQQGRLEAVSLTVADNGGHGLLIDSPDAWIRGTLSGRNGGQGVSAVSGVSTTYSTTFGNGLGIDSQVGGIEFVDVLGYDYRVSPGSTSIDAGDPVDPFGNEPDPNGGRVNQGAFGNTLYATASPTTAPASPSGDQGRSSNEGSCGATGLECLLALAAVGLLRSTRRK